MKATGIDINLDTKGEEAAEAGILINIINAGIQEMLKVEEEQMKATVLTINLDTKAKEAAEALETVILINIINAGIQETLEVVK